ncbi:NAD(P)-dependent oxidoreductase [Sphingomonas paeninsulae]|uniref:NAD(P)-dependent oxidoreductase n=1 Tax=Sphingomonas paeninsulae TaxID=2319844 RepID=A0A494TJZ6_SPHPE|nr:NAD(P)-dependent oxidoreductase [Sphingomonas paeninsulae]AYJ86146.1 NAD(P)-dependent oxidoreductase [Sphingomonas paeninsulae]
MARLWIFGLGYTASRIAARLRADGWEVSGTGRAGVAFDDDAAVRDGVARATHVLSSVPPADDGDPVLMRYGDVMGGALGGRWLGYLSSTGVYGDVGGAWVDESAPVRGRRANRNRADLDWQDNGAHVFRLPGIYGPGRSALERVAEGKAHRIDLPDQIFSRVHVDDIVTGVIAGFDAPAGVYNLSDDHPAPQNAVIEEAAALLGLPVPGGVSLENLSPMARSFYAENRRVANGKAKRVLGWKPIYADFTAGLRALSATISPISATTPPETANNVQ